MTVFCLRRRSAISVLQESSESERVGQVARVMAKQYRLEVGPWVPFLPVLTDHEVPRS